MGHSTMDKGLDSTKDLIKHARAINKKTGWGFFKTFKAYKMANSELGISYERYNEYRFFELMEEEYEEYNARITEENRGGVGVYAPMTSRIRCAEINYEKGKVTNRSVHPAIEPLSEITEPRYVRGEDGIYRSSSQHRDDVADIILLGDIMCRLAQQNAALDKYGKYDFRDMFPHFKDILKKADFVAGNLETTISEGTLYTHEENKSDGTLNRNTPNTILDTLRDAGIDMTVTANNHCLDGGVMGIYQTINHLEQYGLINTGIFFNREDRKRRSNTIVEIDGIKVGFLSYTYGTNEKAKRLLNEDGKKYLTNLYNKKNARKDIENLKKSGAEYIIVYMHWGKEFSHDINAKQRKWEKELADFGADFIAGSHPHVIEPFGYAVSSEGRKIPVIYSMGNCISSMKRAERRDSVAINLKLEKNANKVVVKDITYIPCYTFKEYEDLDYTTVPLNMSLFNDNQEAMKARKRIQDVIGTEIRESEYTCK